MVLCSPDKQAGVAKIVQLMWSLAIGAQNNFQNLLQNLTYMLSETKENGTFTERVAALAYC